MTKAPKMIIKHTILKKKGKKKKEKKKERKKERKEIGLGIVE